MSANSPESQPQDRNRRVQEIFGAALDLPPGERDAFVARECGDDDALKYEVEALLHSFAAAGAFLAEREPDSEAPGHEVPGNEIGRYKLLEKLGEGGFGVVWLAEQSEPVRRKVALKIIKLGMDTRQVVARFEAERQALALMDHPHIAKVHDGGATQSGRPFFVMELVRGIPIVDFCDAESLSTEARIELFCKVCHAVQHAHMKGVIHRDLKPSNILVAMQDGVAVPKIIDFGIAKATRQELTQRTLFTEFRQIVGTPDYMAPEQASQSMLDVDTRVDVYSLGVTLYELLTGARPFDSETLRQIGYAELMQFIREVEPPKPSTRIRALGAALERVAKRRGVPPEALGNALQGDLDWIVMRALEKDRNRRYSTPVALADDLRRHLEQLPVEACPPSARYRLTKFVRRNRGLVAAVGAVVVALVIGVIGTSVMLRRALDAEAAARDDAQRATTILEFTQDMLSSANPYGSDASYTLRQVLDDYHAGLGERLQNQPEIEVEVRSTLGRAYLALGVFDRAAEHLARVVELREAASVAGGDTGKLVDALTRLATARRESGDYDRAEAALARAEQLERDGEGRDEQLARVLLGRATLYCTTGRFEEAEDLAKAALELGSDEFRAGALDTLAEAYRRQNRHEESLAKRQEALEAERAHLPPNHPSVVLARSRLAQGLGELGRHAEAEVLLRESLDRFRESHEAHPHVAETLINLGARLRAQGRLEDALELDNEAIEMCQRVYGPTHQVLGKAYGNRGSTLQHLRRLEEAEADHREALRILTVDLGPDHPDVATTLNNLAVVVAAGGRREEAEQLYLEALRVRRAAFDEPHFTIVQTLLNLAYHHMAADSKIAAEPFMREAIAQLAALHGPRHRSVAEARIRLGALLRRLDRPDEALAEAGAGLAILTEVAPDSPLHLTGNRVLGFSYSTLKRHAEAEPHLLAYLEHARRRNMTAGALGNVIECLSRWQAEAPDPAREKRIAEFRAELEALRESGDSGRE